MMVMSYKGISFALFFGLVAVLATNPFIHLSLMPLKLSLFGLKSRSHHHHHRFHRHHHHHDEEKIVKSVCDDFIPNFPTIDSNVTSLICVDRNGCCNFTTVQAAVDSVGNFSTKRTLIWINKGMYL